MRGAFRERDVRVSRRADDSTAPFKRFRNEHIVVIALATQPCNLTVTEISVADVRGSR
jgi:hypothetical protein